MKIIIEEKFNVLLNLSRRLTIFNLKIEKLKLEEQNVTCNLDIYLKIEVKMMIWLLRDVIESGNYFKYRNK